VGFKVSDRRLQLAYVKGGSLVIRRSQIPAGEIRFPGLVHNRPVTRMEVGHARSPFTPTRLKGGGRPKGGADDWVKGRNKGSRTGRCGWINLLTGKTKTDFECLTQFVVRPKSCHLDG